MYCSIHGAEDFPGCVECEEDATERAAREEAEREGRDLTHQSAPTNLAVPPDENHSADGELPQALAADEALAVDEAPRSAPRSSQA